MDVQNTLVYSGDGQNGKTPLCSVVEGGKKYEYYHTPKTGLMTKVIRVADGSSSQTQTLVLGRASMTAYNVTRHCTEFDRLVIGEFAAQLLVEVLLDGI